MTIRDKQTLRRCVKQAVRRCETVETQLRFDLQSGETGVFDGLAKGRGTPFSPDAAAVCAAMTALELPVYDLSRARTLAQDYEREAYLRELMDAANLKRAYVCVPMEKAQEMFLGDDRLRPLLSVDGSVFERGRYGVNYERAAQQAGEAMRACGASHMLAAQDVSIEAITFALLPLAEDEGFCLHIGLRNVEEARRLEKVVEGFAGARLLVWADCARREEALEVERMLIGLSARMPRVTMRLRGLEQLGLALETLGARFLVYASEAQSMELMAGRWICFKERLYPLLCDAYLPLARAGYELTSEDVERDARAILGGCVTD